jgi:hypothetical protein
VAYERRLDRSAPGCILFLVDQSGSMQEPVAGEPRSKADAVAEALNNLLYELVIRCVKGESDSPRHYYDVGLIGYGSSVGPVFGGALAGRDLVSIVDVADYPLRVMEREAVQLPAAGADAGTVPRRHKYPVWIDPAAGGMTPMSAAMDRAGGVLANWVQGHPQSFPPIVINISDGNATDGDPRVWARRIMSLATQDGNVLLFNLNVSALPARPLFFPDNPAVLENDYARLLFEMSSVLPPYMVELARGLGLQVPPGGRGFVYNADMVAVVRFLQIGTATAQAM